MKEKPFPILLNNFHDEPSMKDHLGQKYLRWKNSLIPFNKNFTHTYYPDSVNIIIQACAVFIAVLFLEMPHPFFIFIFRKILKKHNKHVKG
jgi:hypothetical protein